VLQKQAQQIELLRIGLEDDVAPAQLLRSSSNTNSSNASGTVRS